MDPARPTKSAPDDEHGPFDSASERAEFERLFAALYDDLRSIARRHLRREHPDHTLAPTALVHEAFLRLEGRSEIPWRDRTRFLAFISTAMRRILVDHARRRATHKRGGDVQLVTLDPSVAGADPRPTDLTALDEALSSLGSRHPRLERTVDCRFFGGLSAQETADALGVSLRTSERDWTRAKAYLHELLADAATR
jgi:RNA polymerase sigma-70 factor, ECF subfamily